MFLVNSRYRHFSATFFCSTREVFHIPKAHLLPKLRCHFAEFLNQSYLKRLRIFFLPTCVGLRYDHPKISFRRFSCQYGISQFRTRSTYSLLDLKRERIFLSSQSTSLNRLFQQTADLPSCVPPSLKQF